MIKIILFVLIGTGIFLYIKWRSLKIHKPTLTAQSFQIAYPFPISYFTLQVQQQNLRIAYMDVQPLKPNGKTFLLFHGQHFNGAYWEQTANALSEKGYRVIIPDQTGCGLSSKPKSFQFSFHQIAINTKLLLDSLKISSVIVLGHSMGGMLATRFALLMPHITGKLILESPLGMEDYKLKMPYQTIDEWYANEMHQTPDLLKIYEQENYYHSTWKPAYEKWLKMEAATMGDPEYPLKAWDAALINDMIYAQPVCYEFQNLKCAVLLITGSEDRMSIGSDIVPDVVKKTLGNFPELGKETAMQIQDCRFIELTGIGHIPHIESFDKFISELLAFTDPVEVHKQFEPSKELVN